MKIHKFHKLNRILLPGKRLRIFELNSTESLFSKDDDVVGGRVTESGLQLAILRVHKTLALLHSMIW